MLDKARIAGRPTRRVYSSCPHTFGQRLSHARRRTVRAAVALALIAAATAAAPISAAESPSGSDETSVPAEAAAPLPAATEQTRNRSLSFEVGSGLQYDSNVAVLDLDTSANTGDTAALLEFGAGYRRQQQGRLGLQAGYNFSQTLHEDFDAFDVGIHRGSADLSLDLAGVDTGIMLQYAQAALDGDEFLVLSQVSPYMSKLVGKRLFLRFAYVDGDKEFAGNPARDATTNAVSADAFVFLNGLETYLVFGVRYDEEDALDEQFDFTGHKLRAQLSRRIPLGTRKLTLKAQLRYEARDYERPTLSIGERRDDDRYQFEATADLPLGEHLVTTAGYKRADNRSNLPAVNFDESVYSVGFRATF